MISDACNMFTTTLAFPFTYDEISTFCNDKAFIITENANAQKDISAKCHPERSASVVEGSGAEMPANVIAREAKNPVQVPS